MDWPTSAIRSIDYVKLREFLAFESRIASARSAGSSPVTVVCAPALPRLVVRSYQQSVLPHAIAADNLDRAAERLLAEQGPARRVGAIKSLDGRTSRSFSHEVDGKA